MLATRAGVSVKIVIAVVGTLVAGTMVTEMSSDAAKAGTANPGLGGHLHGYTWRCALLAEDIEGVFEIAIAVLEFAALVINLMTFARRIALGRRVIIVVTDSSTTADALVDARARADLMQFCYEELNNYPPLAMLKGRLYVQHGWGDGNTVSDASSRGYDDVLAALCRNMRVRHEHVDVPLLQRCERPHIGHLAAEAHSDPQKEGDLVQRVLQLRPAEHRVDQRPRGEQARRAA